jgi:hypothetical protein
MYENSTTWEAYMQYLSENAEPIKIPRTKDMMSEPAQPHWFSDDGLKQWASKQMIWASFVVWSEFPAGSQMLNKNDLTKSSVQNGSVGRTVVRKFWSHMSAIADIRVDREDENIELAPVPMTGGITPDGKFLATGTNPAYLLKLP